MADTSDAGTGQQTDENDLRTITEQELKDILDAYRVWLETDERDGKRSVLKRANLKGANLRGANLEGADLTGTDLSGLEFGDTNLKDAILRDALLINADLNGAKGLQERQLAGTDLSGAILPENIAEFLGLERALEISKRVRTVLMSLVGACLLCWLILGTMTDADLLHPPGPNPLAGPPSKRPRSRVLGRHAAYSLWLVSLSALPFADALAPFVPVACNLLRRSAAP